ncbi:MAG: aldehyde dehydrogenase family protein, partial [Acidimicrobiia bacterium]|nr:aldehyde dehydrogenase family protein [Acidimicrobiia bacterium]
EELHERYEAALKDVRAKLGLTHSMIIDGKDVQAQETFEDRSPIDTELVLGVFQKGNQTHAEAAIAAARKAFPDWSRRPWTERVELLRKVSDRIDERIYEIAAVISLEVGKNRMEALGDIAEVSALIRYACDQVEENNGFIVKMGQDPLKGYTAINTSVLRPYGVWLVISP